MKRLRLLLILPFAGILLFLFFINFSFVDAGHKGVLYNWLSGSVSEEPRLPGSHVYVFYYDMYEYDCRLLEIFEQMNILSKNGLKIGIELTARYNIKGSSLKHIFNNIGRDNEAVRQKIVIPELRSATRQVVGRYLEEELYSTRRDEIENEIQTQLEQRLEKHGIAIEAILLRDVSLPQQIQEAIQTKLKFQQEALAYEFKIETARKEADRKRIEAEGIKDFQRIVSTGITPDLLKWKGIEATQELAKSQNSKIVIIGSGRDGMPIILGDY